MTVRFERVTLLPVEPTAAFDLSLDVDLHLESMIDSGEMAVAGVTSGEMGPGDEVTWRARHFGIWWTMTSEITEYDRPRRFVDEQKSGPFRRFHHEHLFEPHADGATSMTDRIEFEAPLGPLGLIAERLVLGRYLPILIDRRNAEILDALTRRG